jgi:hypothetical protein
MICEKTKEGAAQTTAGKCSQEEARNGEATVRTQQKGTNVHGNKANKKCSAALTVSNKFFLFFLQVLK